MSNREHVREVIEAGQGDTSDFEPVIMEHQLSVLDKARGRTLADAAPPKRTGLGGLLRSALSGPKPQGDISVESEAGHTVYAAAEGRRLFSYSDEGTRIEPDLGRRFVQFLRERYHGHPLILERLASEGRVPREIQYSAKDMRGFPGSTITLRVQSANVVPDSGIPLEGYRRVVQGRPGLPDDATLERVTLGAAPDSAQVRERRQMEAKESVDAGRMLDSVLAFFELTLQTGEAVPGLGEAIQSTPDADMRRFWEVMLRSSDNAAASTMAATLVELRAAAGPHAHVLKSFESGARRTLNEPQEAHALLLEVIEANPFFTWAYTELGDICVADWDMGAAWLCWDAARNIAPGHHLLKDVSALEEMLAAKHPEYF
ncbi:hypothetical protein BHS07_27775 [Myxococcus xanthus]|uniref:Uncharacterized protein n=1 Tax=Myxococcus xanthus TaxID=34 RepID=A0AAE6KUF9_MYXXA|nr:hypothetical protein [Myxococcus xanthus]QDE70357.1 hypothetical protein BHS09_27210 [Myxococcus xanthus]QDE77636.1 hypothetical protein BHS08_27230 [Myxococcus xanthus]QDE85023.1 hypothetical protein BHS07_27775 [Myxococcus xanthus]